MSPSKRVPKRKEFPFTGRDSSYFLLEQTPFPKGIGVLPGKHEVTNVGNLALNGGEKGE